MNRSIGLLFIWSLCVSMHSFALPAVKTPYWKSMQSAGSNAFDSLKKHPRIIAATAAFLFAAKFGISAYKNTQDYRIQRRNIMLNYFISQHSNRRNKPNNFITQDLNGDLDEFDPSNPPQQPDIAISHKTEKYKVFHPFFDTEVMTSNLTRKPEYVDYQSIYSPLYYLIIYSTLYNNLDDNTLKMAALDFILSSDRDKEQLLLETNGRLFFYLHNNYIHWHEQTDGSRRPDRFLPYSRDLKNWNNTGWSNLLMMPEEVTSDKILGLNRWGKALEWAREYIKTYPKLTRWNVRYGWLTFLY